jgi:hypothetical protein
LVPDRVKHAVERKIYPSEVSYRGLGKQGDS